MVYLIDMQHLVIDCTKPKDKDFNSRLYRYLDIIADYDVVNIEEIGESTLGKYKTIIITGVPVTYPLDSIYETAKRLECIKSVNIPVLGICLGHQVIGVLFGSKIYEHGEAEHGDRKVTIVNDDKIFKDMSHEFHAQTLHTASVSLPHSFKHLAKSYSCHNESMKHKEKDIYGFQFHPEFKESSRAVIRNFILLN